MATNTDTQFAARFAGVTAGSYYGNQAALSGYTPSQSVLNTGLMGDIGRAMINGPDTQDSFYGKFMQNELARGDAVLMGRFQEINSTAYDPNAPDSALFQNAHPAFIGSVAQKNFSRQIRLPVNDRYLKQMAQTPEMIGDMESAIMASMNACAMDDLWVGSKYYFSGSTRGAKATQNITISDVTDGDKIIEALFTAIQKDMGYKSTKFNASGVNTKSESVHVALKKDLQYPVFKKLADTFHPDLLPVSTTFDYVDDFATPAGMPSGATELVGMIADTRAFAITPVPEAVSVESFRNPARKETVFCMTSEYIMQHAPFYNVMYLYK